jgi:hypothetical protein
MIQLHELGADARVHKVVYMAWNIWSDAGACSTTRASMPWRSKTSSYTM